jgi:hypothetical protein
MATELDDLGQRLRDGGFPEGGSLVCTLARSLRGLRLIPPRLPIDHHERLRRYRTRMVVLDVTGLRRLREERQLSRRGLALAARLSPSYICNVEARGSTLAVRWTTVAALAEALAVTPETLIAPDGKAQQ